MENEYEQVYTTYGNLQAEMIRLFLLSFGIHAHSYQESAGAAYGLTVGPLGEVKIFVRAEQAKTAWQILQDMEAGKYELPAVETPQQDSGDSTETTGDDPV